MRPRDLYDVVLLGGSPMRPDAAADLRETAIKKFRHKGLVLPTVAEVTARASRDEELRSEWESMLAHQLPALPPLDDFLARLPASIDWLEQPPGDSARKVGVGGTLSTLARIALNPVPRKSGESLVFERSGKPWGIAAPLEAIRFAGASHLLLQFSYNGAMRRVEPYSLRRARTGNLLLYAWEQTKNGFLTGNIRAYNVAEIVNLQILGDAFTPRFAIELTEQSGVWHW